MKPLPLRAPAPHLYQLQRRCQVLDASLEAPLAGLTDSAERYCNYLTNYCLLTICSLLHHSVWVLLSLALSLAASNDDLIKYGEIGFSQELPA